MAQTSSGTFPPPPIFKFVGRGYMPTPFYFTPTPTLPTPTYLAYLTLSLVNNLIFPPRHRVISVLPSRSSFLPATYTIHTTSKVFLTRPVTRVACRPCYLSPVLPALPLVNIPSQHRNCPLPRHHHHYHSHQVLSHLCDASLFLCYILLLLTTSKLYSLFTVLFLPMAD